MFRQKQSDGPERLQRREAAFIPNDVVITTVKSARNDDHPHYLNVAAGVAPASRSFDDPSVDGVFQRLGLGPTAVSRVFIPRSELAEPQRERGAAAIGATRISANYAEDEDSSGLSRTYKVSFENPVDVRRTCHDLLQSKAVDDARPNYISEIYTQPDDEFYGYQWGLDAIDCEEAWDVETGHPDVKLAIVDSGVDFHHDDLASKLLAGEDFVDLMQFQFGWGLQLTGDYRTRDPNPDDEDGHGTHCAGIAAALSNNALGTVGVCWGGNILPVRVMARAYSYNWFSWGRETSIGSDVDIDAGIKYAIDAGAHAINLSLGGTQPSHDRVLDYAHDRNVAVLAATGNADATDASYPASNPKVLAVGAVDENKNRASFSNYGPKYNRFVMAPGVHIASTYKNNEYVYLDGTSMATPFVTGLVGLIVSLSIRSGRQLAVDDIYSIIRETAQSIGDSHNYGAGLVDAKAALEEAKNRIG